MLDCLPTDWTVERWPTEHLDRHPQRFCFYLRNDWFCFEPFATIGLGFFILQIPDLGWQNRYLHHMPWPLEDCTDPEKTRIVRIHVLLRLDGSPLAWSFFQPGSHGKSGMAIWCSALMTLLNGRIPLICVSFSTGRV